MSVAAAVALRRVDGRVVRVYEVPISAHLLDVPTGLVGMEVGPKVP